MDRVGAENGRDVDVRGENSRLLIILNLALPSIDGMHARQDVNACCKLLLDQPPRNLLRNFRIPYIGQHKKRFGHDNFND